MPLWAKQQFTQFDVDNKCRILTADNHLLNKTFGSGLAFPMRSNDGQIIPDQGKANPRADSFSLYLNFVANTMLQNLLPKTKIDSKLHRTMRQDKTRAEKDPKTPTKPPSIKNVI